MEKIIFFLLLAPIACLSQANTSHYSPEKAYLQFDKPFYAAGDTLYFKAYVVDAVSHRPSTLSGVLHVDLINRNNKIDQSIKLHLDSGMAWGDFVLPDSLPNANYRVRAYTRWMLNDENNFFNKVIPVGSMNKIQLPQTTTAEGETDIQFFPEGGSFVSGISSKMSFKAIDLNGMGTAVKGTIVNQNNREICTFTSTHLGMGCFYFTPKEGETYRAKYTDANSKAGEITLPGAKQSGITLSVNNDSLPKASVKIEADATYFSANQGKSCSLTIYSGGKTSAFTCTLNNPVITFDILKRKLRSGVAVITLRAPDGEPLCERLIFVQNYNQLNLELNSDKPGYAAREKVKFKLRAKDRADSASHGHFSVSVVDERLVHADEVNEHTVITDLLLTSDLKGYVEQPNYYFMDTSPTARQDLDILMLTQGYRKFDWKKEFAPEVGLDINGTIKNESSSKLNGGTVTLIPQSGGTMLSSVSDENGRFHFDNLVFFDTTRFVLSAVKANGKNSTKITYLPAEDIKAENFIQLQGLKEVNDTVITAYVNKLNADRSLLPNYGKVKGVLLKEVDINAKKKDDKYATQSFAGAGHADQVLHNKDLLGGQLSTSLYLLNGVAVVTKGTSTKLYLRQELAMAGMRRPVPMTVVIDGNISNSSMDINMISPSLVETIELLKDANASIYGMNGTGGVLIITTKQGGANPKDIASVGVLPIAPVGFYKAREFYSPKYDNVNLSNKQRDFRSTIYWKPEFATDKDGNAWFEFYNAGDPGTYKVVVEGIDENGNLGRQVFRYQVQ